MALHVRYTDGRQNDTRIQVKFTRLDLLWQTDETLILPTLVTPLLACLLPLMTIWSSARPFSP
jgi:hypothetical protein